MTVFIISPRVLKFCMKHPTHILNKIQYWDFREWSLRAVTALKDHTTALKDHTGALNDPQVLEFQCKTHPQN